MIIQNASALGLDRQINFFGDNVFRYKITKNISIEGNVLDLQNTFNVSGIESGVETYIQNYTKDWEPIIINNVNFGSGFINNLSFTEGNDVKQKTYTAEFIVFETGSLNWNPADYNYSGIDSGSFIYLSEFNETFQTNVDQKRTRYVHNINVRFQTPSTGISIALSKNLAQNLINSEDLTGFFWSGYTPYNTLYTESYNQISADCSFTKTYELVSGTGYLFSRNHTFDYAENGVISITETAEYRGKYDSFAPIIVPAYQSDILNAYSRCNDVFNTYNFDANYYLLNPTGTSKQVTQLPREGYLSYSLTFSNDMYFRTGAYWSYTNIIDQDELGINQISENGNIIGFDVIDNYLKQNNANAFWLNTVRNSIAPRLSGLYSQFHLSPVAESNIYLVNKNVTKNNRNGRVDYTFSYTDDPNRTNVNGLKSINHSCSNVERIKLSSNIIIPKYIEMKQISENYNVKPYGLTIRLIGNGNMPLDDYLTLAYSQINFCTGDYIDSVNYTYDPFNREFVLNLNTNGIECFG